MTIEGVILRGEYRELKNYLRMATYSLLALAGGLAIALFAGIMALGVLRLAGIIF